MTTAEYLTTLSQEICQDNECTEDEHNCESYAYFNRTPEGSHELMDVCISDYCQCCYDVAVPMPFEGNSDDLLDQIEQWED